MIATNHQLIDALQAQGLLKDPLHTQALEAVDRKDFVPQEFAAHAYEDAALPLVSGQTISQPYTVAFMLTLLAPKRGENIMDVGAGSGWQTALLAHIVGEEGHVYAIERIREVWACGKEHLSKYPALSARISWICTDAVSGLSDISADIKGFDGIIAAATVSRVPHAWRDQLACGGRLVYPCASSIWKEEKQREGVFKKEEYPGFVFVPFVSDYAM